MKSGILLMNTGSPAAPETKAVRRYLRAFLMDPHVLDVPWLLRAMIVYGAILPRRPARSAEAYKAVWTANGSPLVVHCSELAMALRQRLNQPVALGMAYGRPSVRDGVEQLMAGGVERIRLLPLFPHYANATVGACVDKVKKISPVPVDVVAPFYKHPAFIRPLADSLAGCDEHILFSYHGLPVRQLQKTDPTRLHCLAKPDCCQTGSVAHATCYRHQCYETTKAVVTAAGIAVDRYSVAFQSRLGRAEWMEPYTDETLKAMPARGIKKVTVVCPAFFCDCLETLEELGIRGREIFHAAGGESFRLIPCLNHSAAAVDCLQNILCDEGNAARLE